MKEQNHKTNHVFVLDKNRNPLQLCSPARARILQDQGKAKRLRMYPFTLILDKEINSEVTQELEIRIDPGSKTTGIALIDIKTQGCIWALHIEHRGESIKNNLIDRAGYRGSRRTRKVRHRKARYHQRKKPDGWLPPSLMHRVKTIETWVKRLSRLCNVAKISVERGKFDTQLMENEAIKGKDYQSGTLMGYEIRDFLLEKWGSKCSYCGKKNVPLEVEHIHPQSKGGSDRISNLCMSCHECNQEKADRDIEDFLRDKPEVLEKIKSQQKRPLNDVAAVNSINNKLLQTIEYNFTDIEVFEGRGSLTKMTRIKNEQPKDHWIDAANVAGFPVKLSTLQPLIATCKGHGSRQMVRNNDSGFPAISNIEKEPLRKPRDVVTNGKKSKKTRVKVKRNRQGLRIPKLVVSKEIYKHASAGDIVRVNLDKPSFLKDKKTIRIPAGVFICKVKTPIKKNLKSGKQYGVEVLINEQRKETYQYKMIHHCDGYFYSFPNQTEVMTKLFGFASK